MEAAGVADTLDITAPTILKDNISWHFPYLSANTTPWQLEGTIKALHSFGYKDLVAVHNNTVVTNPFKGEKLNKLDRIYEKYDVPELFNFRDEDMSWVIYTPKAEMLALHKVYPEGIRIPDFFIGKNVVHLPTVKTHIYTTTTGAMKNAFGGLLGTRRHYTHTWIHETLVDLLAIQQEIHPGIFCVKDGTICGNGPGPRTMIPVEKDLVLASADQVAIDAIAAKMMGFNPLEIPYLRLAHDRGLGVADPAHIEVIGEDISEEDWNFFVGRNFAARFGHFLWFGPMKRLQKMLFHTSFVYAFVFGSFVYHDYFWWPLRGTRIQADVRRETKWGRLFEQY